MDEQMDASQRAAPAEPQRQPPARAAAAPPLELLRPGPLDGSELHSSPPPPLLLAFVLTLRA